MVNKVLTDDLGAVFSGKDFGEDIPAVLQGDTASPIPGIFDDEHVEVEQGEGIAVMMPQASFTCPSSKVSTIAEGQTLLIRSVTYTVRTWQHDGSGITTIYLEAPGGD